MDIRFRYMTQFEVSSSSITKVCNDMFLSEKNVFCTYSNVFYYSRSKNSADITHIKRK